MALFLLLPVPHGEISTFTKILSEFQTCKETQDIGALTKAADFVKAFVLGFQVEVSVKVNSLSLFTVVLSDFNMSN